MLFLGMAAWALASPPLSAEDEDFHLASIWCGQGERPGLCEPGESANARSVPVAFASGYPCYWHRMTVTGTCLDLNGGSLKSTSRLNTNGDYPPVYYFVMSVFASPNLEASVVAIRCANALLFVGLASAVFLLLPRWRRFGHVMSWSAVIVPAGIFFAASVNPSSWAITGIGAAWFGSLAFFEGSGRRRWLAAGLALAGCFMSAGSRADAGVYAFLAVLATCFLTLRTRHRSMPVLKDAWLPFAAAILAAAVTSTTRQTAAVVAGPSHTVIQADDITGLYQGFGLFVNNLFQVPELWLGNFGIGLHGDLGWFDLDVPPVAQVFAAAAFAALLMLGLSANSFRKSLVLLGVCVILVGVPLYMDQKSHFAMGLWLQPRYLWPAVFILGAAATFAPAGARLRISRWHIALLGGGAAIANAMTLYAVMRRFVVASPQSTSLGLGHISWWWTWSSLIPAPNIVLGIGVASFGSAAVLALTLTPRGVPAPARAARIATSTPHVEVQHVGIPRMPPAAGPGLDASMGSYRG